VSSEDSTVFNVVAVLFVCFSVGTMDYEPLRLAWWNFAGTNMYLDYCKNHIEAEGHRSKSRSPDRIFGHL